MTKEELLQELAVKIGTGEITQNELSNRFNVAQPHTPKLAENMSVNKMLYILGGAIVVIGIVIFVGQVWEDIGSFGRIFVTLGLGLIFSYSGMSLLRSKVEDKIGPLFLAMGGLLIPGGAVVALNEASFNGATPWSLTLTFGAILAFYLIVNSIKKNPVPMLFAIGNGTAFMYFLLTAMLDGSAWNGFDPYAYLTMALGIGYILLGYSFQGTINNSLTRPLYFFGTIGLMGAAFSQVFGSPAWQLFYFILVIGGLVTSVRLKTSAILVVSTLFLIAHVSYITGKYFADSLGWPLALIMLGFIFIGLGYLSITINRRYIA